jgi:hypothetical protein
MKNRELIMMLRHALSAIFFLYAFSTSVSASPDESSKSTFHDCQPVNHFGKIVLVSYCPADIPPKELASFVSATKGIWLIKYGFVQYRIFSTKENLPRNMDEIMKKSDAWFEKYEVGSALFNASTGAEKLSCRKTPKSEVTDCSALLKSNK